MTSIRVDRLALFGAAVLFATAAAAMVGCASGRGAKATQAADRKTPAKEKEAPPPPLQEELKDAPCGNPNWSRLPEQHRVDGDREPSTSETEQSTSSSKRTDEAEEASSPEGSESSSESPSESGSESDSETTPDG